MGCYVYLTNYDGDKLYVLCLLIAGLSFSIQSQEFNVFHLLKQPRENVFMLVVFSSAASAIVLFFFFCCLFKWKKGGSEYRIALAFDI